MKAKTLFIIILVLIGLTSCNTNQIPTPIISPAGGTYTEPQTVTISCDLENTEVRYTLDGSEPTQSSTLYQEPFILSEPTTIKAKAFKAKIFKFNWHKSKMLTVNYEFKVCNPGISLAEGTYSIGRTLSISCLTLDAEIRYTTNGVDPIQNSELYINPIIINTDFILKARAFKDNWFSSDIISKSYSVDMVFVEGGTFQMGSNTGQNREKPVHSVTVSSFYIGKYEVTQKEWVAVMGSNPSNFKNHHLPVEMVSWYDVLVYCNLRSIKEGLTPVYTIRNSINPKDWGSVPTFPNIVWDAVICNWNANGYRLPTEAEWEYAARGGNKSKGFTYSGSNNIDEVAWYLLNSGDQQLTIDNLWGTSKEAKENNCRTRIVGTKAPNELGIYDMSGNVFEWCWDWHVDSYTSGSVTNPTGTNSGYARMFRGGSWGGGPDECSVSYRVYPNPYARSQSLGFRCVRSAD